MYDRIYSIGCFDQFHYGHKELFRKMRKAGKEIIVGIHDDRSIEQLKRLHPSEHHDVQTRINNIKPFVDSAYVVPDTDPTFWLAAMIRPDDNKESACFIRGDDMPNFPGRALIESVMAIELVPYTEGISATQIRLGKKG